MSELPEEFIDDMAKWIAMTIKDLEDKDINIFELIKEGYCEGKA